MDEVRDMAGGGRDGAASPVDAATRERVIAVIVKEGMLDRDRLKPDATLSDLQIESIDVVQILMGLEDEFGVYIPVDGPLASVTRFGELVDVLAGIVSANAARPAR